ncbi:MULTISPECIES: amidohydrolase family protein [unclassified Rhodococcus (in: high G+C Gram-positive bacteria)]|uniref:amidohydrolase family protein n=1 Tax=unclassified Rhodococcus (in: high G+C Gram-positive bacteria) TaxID=192944 RepID=UPI0008360DA3|nr:MULTISPECIES: amidohydrolase family protein [unclassified Rhodococcus (in: high G+C Gram-positive bacteria)]
MTNVVDAHMHQIDPLATPRAFSGAARRWAADAENLSAAVDLLPPGFADLGDPLALFVPYLPTDYVADAVGLPVCEAVHIQVGWASEDPSEETAWVSGLQFEGMDIGAIIGAGDPRDAGFGALVEAHMRASRKFRGVRFMTAHHEDPGVISVSSRPSVLIEPDSMRGIAELADRDLILETWVYAHQLPDIAVVAGEYPELSIVVDHLGLPAGAFGPAGEHAGASKRVREELFRRWSDAIEELAAHPNVVLKHSGLGSSYLGMPEAAWSDLDRLEAWVGPYLEQAFEALGGDRSMWGSDFHNSRGHMSMHDIAELHARSRSPRELDLLFRENARKIYRIGELPDNPSAVAEESRGS